jgi:hypothetical protein
MTKIFGFFYNNSRCPFFNAGGGRQAAQLSEEAYLETRKKAMIAYNFVAGGELTGYCLPPPLSSSRREGR